MKTNHLGEMSWLIPPPHSCGHLYSGNVYQVFDCSDVLVRRREQMEVLVDRPFGNEWPVNLEVESPEFKFRIPPLDS